jgi:hypothetical protein
MTAVVWALFGLTAAMLGILATAVFGAFGRVDGLYSAFSGRFDGLHEDMREVRAELRDLRSAVLGLDRRLTAAGG